MSETNIPMNVRSPEIVPPFSSRQPENLKIMQQEMRKYLAQLSANERKLLAYQLRQPEGVLMNSETNENSDSDTTNEGTDNVNSGPSSNPQRSPTPQHDHREVHSTYRGFARAAGVTALGALTLPYLAVSIPSVVGNALTTASAASIPSWLPFTGMAFGGALGGWLGASLPSWFSDRERPVLSRSLGVIGAGTGASLGLMTSILGSNLNWAGAGPALLAGNPTTALTALLTPAAGWSGAFGTLGAWMYGLSALGLPVLGGTLGYGAFKRMGLPPWAGAALGAGGTGLGFLAATGALSTSLTLAGAGVGVGLAGTALYGLGRLHRWAWGSDPNMGLGGTLLRGAIAPISLPLRLVTKIGERLSPTVTWPFSQAKNMVTGAFEGFGGGTGSGLGRITAAPGRMVRGVGSAVASIPRATWNLGKWLLEKPNSSTN